MRNLVFILLFILLPASVLAQENIPPELTIEDVHKKAESLNLLRSLLIKQHGEVISERFFGYATPDYPYNVKSVSKSIISLLAGIAIDKGFIKSVDEPISTYFPEYFAENPDSIKARITIKNLLTMQTGLETTSRENYGRWIISDDWIEFALDQPLIDKPGGELIYSTGTSHILAVIIAKASGMSIKQFANKYFFRPMNIRVGDWDKDPKGNYTGGNNMALTPDALLKIGQLILDTGTYNGERIVSKQWIIDSFKTYATSPLNSYNYGYMWWNTTINNYKVFFAWGFGGQYIFLLPQLDAVVVVTSKINPSDQEREYQYPIFDLLEDYIIPFLSQSYLQNN